MTLGVSYSNVRLAAGYKLEHPKALSTKEYSLVKILKMLQWTISREVYINTGKAKSFCKPLNDYTPVSRAIQLLFVLDKDIVYSIRN